MDDSRFDLLTRRLSAGASRRRLLAGLGLATVGTLLGASAEAAPSARARCNRQCTSTARTARAACAELERREKGACLREAARAQHTCKVACRTPENGGV
jgi:hypothetical protein